MKHKPWTEEQEQFLLDHHEEMSNIELGEKLNKSRNAIYGKKRRMGLSNRALYEVSKGYETLAIGTAKECARKLSVDINTIYYYATETNLRRRKNLDKSTMAIRLN